MERGEGFPPWKEKAGTGVDVQKKNEILMRHYDTALGLLFIVHEVQKMKEKRTRNWACLIYPRQSAEDRTECPENWPEVLEQLGVKAAVSPLHDRDVYESDKVDENTGELIHKAGDLKKPHRHVLFTFEGVKSERQVKELFAKIGGVGCEPINSLYAQVRYLTHKDNADKAQYSSLDVLTFGGFEYKRYASTRDDEERDTTERMGKIFNIMAEGNLDEFCHVAEYLWQNEPELFATFRRNSYFFAQFIRSKQDFTKRLAVNELYLQQGRSVEGLHNPQTLPPSETEKGGNHEN